MRNRNKAIAAITLALMSATSLSFADSKKADAVLSEIVVTGSRKSTYAAQDITVGKYVRPLLDTPQSVSVVGKQLLEDQHITTLRDTVKNVPGISLAAGEGGAQGDSLTLRGFTARNDIFLDGMRDFGSYHRDSYNWDRVEVLKGPSSIAFGRGSTGGVVNQVSKVPEKGSEHSVDVTLGSNLKERITFDSNDPITQLGDGVAFRLNAMQETSRVSGRDITKTNRWGVAPSLAFGLGSDSRLTVSYFHSQADDVPDYGLPFLFHKPADVDMSNFYGFKSDYLKTQANVATVKYEKDFNDNFSLRNQVRYGYYTRDVRVSEARIAGTPSENTPLSSISITRNEINRKSTETFLQNQFDVTSKFDTGSLGHTMVSGVEVGRETSTPKRYTITGVPGTTLVNPDHDQEFAGTNTAPNTTEVRTESYGIYAVDTVKLNDQWELTGGVRMDQFNTDFTQITTSTLELHRTDNVTSWRGGIVYKPVEDGSIYFGYGTSFNPSGEALSLSAGTVNLNPEENQTYELGTKWSLLSNQLVVRSSIFRTDKLNARETDPLDSNNITLSGDQRVEGFEFEAAGKITDAWQISFGYAYLKSEVRSSVFFPDAVGEPLANVPKHTFNFWTTYQLPYACQVGFGGNYVGERRASSTAPFDTTTGKAKEAPDYWVFNAMFGHQVSKQMDIQLNIYNLFNADYIDQVHSGHLVPGEKLAAILSATLRF